MQQLRRGTWGLTAVRAFARHRLRREQFVGAERRPRAVQARGAAEGEWEHGDSGRFQAWAARATGAQAGQSAARSGGRGVRERSEGTRAREVPGMTLRP